MDYLTPRGPGGWKCLLLVLGQPGYVPGYPEKLTAMSEAVHAKGGLWIAPAAPGFDAAFDWRDRPLSIGKTVRRCRSNSTRPCKSSPDAIGLISWNEFSENSQIEPSENYGHRYLNVLADIRNVPAPVIRDFDSSEPGDTSTNLSFAPITALGLVGLLTLAGLVVLIRRNRR